LYFLKNNCYVGDKQTSTNGGRVAEVQGKVEFREDYEVMNESDISSSFLSIRTSQFGAASHSAGNGIFQ
jgi:hypothetical protein